jgi:hypothetical protein
VYLCSWPRAQTNVLLPPQGGCPHAAIREDISANLTALEGLQADFGCDLLFVESGGDNLAGSHTYSLRFPFLPRVCHADSGTTRKANYSRELADYIIYVVRGWGLWYMIDRDCPHIISALVCLWLRV